MNSNKRPQVSILKEKNFYWKIVNPLTQVILKAQSMYLTISFTLD